MRVYSAGWAQRFCCCWAHGHWVEAIVSIKQRYTISHRGGVVVCELRHRQQGDPIALFPADERSQVGLGGLFQVFYLSVCLQVEGS